MSNKSVPVQQNGLFEPDTVRRGRLSLLMTEDGRAVLELTDGGHKRMWLELTPDDQAFLISVWQR